MKPTRKMPTRNMLAARAEKRTAAWRQRNAALFADSLAQQLEDSMAFDITALVWRKLSGLPTRDEETQAGERRAQRAEDSHRRLYVSE